MLHDTCNFVKIKTFLSYPNSLLRVRSPASSTTTKQSPMVVIPVTCAATYFEPKLLPLQLNTWTE